MQLTRLHASQAGFDAALTDLRARLSPQGDVVSEAGRAKTVEVFGEALSPGQVVDRICGEVRNQGLSAVLHYCKALDKADLMAETIRVPHEELVAAHQQAEPKFLAAIEAIRKRIEIFQRSLLVRDVTTPLAGGGYLSQRYLPLRRVGVCVPGGAAAYPSTVLMTVVPAQTAGVSQIAVMAPPTPFGSYNTDLLATCHALGVTEVYRMGGAHGVAALAYGVEGIPRVDKIVGPGNLFVALAKRRVFGDVAIDSIAGPSEVVVVADETSHPAWIAADMIAQAEHSPGASIVISLSQQLLNDVEHALTSQLSTLTRGALAESALRDFGALVGVENRTQLVEVVNGVAPEHLHVQTQDAAELAPLFTTAGAMFIGPYSPVASGDYAAGPSHVLPTSGTARFASGLNANDFLRGHSVIALAKDDLAALASDIDILAHKEGLSGHAASVAIRFNSDR